jgi:hypothetical protein
MQVNKIVIVHTQERNYETASKSIGRIVGETKTSWRVKYGGTETDLFRKKDLHLRTSDDFCCTKMIPYSQEEWKQYQRELLRRTIVRTLSKYNWNELDNDTLALIHKTAQTNKLKNQKAESV